MKLLGIVSAILTILAFLFIQTPIFNHKSSVKDNNVPKNEIVQNKENNPNNNSSNKIEPDNGTKLNENEHLINQGITFIDNQSNIVIAISNIYSLSKKATINLTCPGENSEIKYINLGDVLTIKDIKDKEYSHKITITEINDSSIRIILNKEKLENNIQAKDKASEIIGIYEGTSTIGRYTYGFKLNIYQTSEDTAEAKANFYVLPNNQNVPVVNMQNECLMKVNYTNDNNTLIITGYKWIYLPSNYTFFDLYGKLDNGTLRGDVLNGSNYQPNDIGKKMGEFTVKINKKSAL